MIHKCSGRCLLLILGIVLVGTGCDLGSGASLTPTLDTSEEAAILTRPLRLFVVRSYGEEDPWSNRVRAGILEKLAQSGYDRASETLVLGEFALQVEQLSNPTAVEVRVDAAIRSIQAFDADLVIVVDDEAARWVIREYPDPQLFVFCGLNSTAWELGLDRPDVAGVSEIVYPVKTVHMAASMMTTPPKSVVFLTDTSMAGKAEAISVREALLDDDEQLVEDLRVQQTGDWEEWQLMIMDEVSEADLILLGHYNQLVDDSGASIPVDVALRWTLENSPVPIFGLRLNTIDNGAVGGLAVSGYEQGRQAADLALSLFRGASPNTLPLRKSERNVLAVNVAAAQYWDLEVPVEFLIAARVARYFPISIGGQ